jgi:threonine dehydrogenase-like Zn-dependent dehydrogenase
MKAVCFAGTNDVRVERVKDPEILNPRDAIIRVTATTICGSDLHIYGGYIPTMREGDILGHEFMGEVVEVGREVKNLAVGDRVVVPSTIGCGGCFHCKRDEWSLCDNTNPNAGMAEKLWGYSPCGIFGYSHLLGGYAGSHAEYVRVPFADVGPFKVPNGYTEEQLMFLSDAVPTGYMGADMCNITPGDVVAVWGAGAVGLMAMQVAKALGAGKVIAIDRFADRLELAKTKAGAIPLNYEKYDVYEMLRELSGGRGPDACIDAVGMEAHAASPSHVYDQVKQQTKLEQDRPHVLREMMYVCRKGGTLSIMGVYSGMVDKIPMGAAMNKALTMRMGQMFGQKYGRLGLERLERGEIDPSFLVTHTMSLDEAPKAYRMFKEKTDRCLRVLLKP